MKRWLEDVAEQLLGQCWPGCCICCGAAAGQRDLCNACNTELPRQHSVCRRCALPLPRSGICGPCLNAPPPFVRCRSLFWYSAPASDLITSFKHRGQLNCGRMLAELMACNLPAQLEVDALVPVPLHWRRRWRRGFNQAEELAFWLGRATGIPVLRALSRTRATASQQGLDARARRRNLQHAFGLRRPVDGLRLALVDDVVTTASTGSILARLLRREGAHSVELWCVARTPPPGWAASGMGRPPGWAGAVAHAEAPGR